MYYEHSTTKSNKKAKWVSGSKTNSGKNFYFENSDILKKLEAEYKKENKEVRWMLIGFRPKMVL
jgi:hypothetical protein